MKKSAEPARGGPEVGPAGGADAGGAASRYNQRSAPRRSRPMTRRLLTLSLLAAALAASAAHAQPPADGLRVGVRRLPERLSPALATTDNELRAVELLFQGLVKISEGPDGVSSFRPALADGPPRLVPQG